VSAADPTYVFMPAGSVEYAADAAAVAIEDLIAALEEAQEDGATHVVGLSGNYRGASYVRLSARLDWDEQ
jgi:hypothetical protein